jgi:hypothetical protein
VVAGPQLILLLAGCGPVEEDRLNDADDDTAIGAPFTALDFALCRESNEVWCVARGDVCADLRLLPLVVVFLERGARWAMIKGF